MDWCLQTQVPGLLAPTDPYNLDPWHLVTTLDGSAALLLPPHLLHGRRTMGLLSNNEQGPGERTQGECVLPFTLAQSAGQGLPPEHLGFSPPSYNTLPFSLV